MENEHKRKISDIMQLIKGGSSFDGISPQWWLDTAQRCQRWRECNHDPVDCYKITMGKKLPFMDCELKK